jgi:cytidylate kinase
LGTYGIGDGKVTLAELKAYLDEEMTYQARRRWSRGQNASVQGVDSSVLATLR